MDLRRPVNGDQQDPGGPGERNNSGAQPEQLFKLPETFEARYTNFPRAYRARYDCLVLVLITSREPQIIKLIRLEVE